MMEKNKKRLNIGIVMAVNSLILTLVSLYSALKEWSVMKALPVLFLTVVVILGMVILSMLFNRLITTRWGNPFHVLLLSEGMAAVWVFFALLDNRFFIIVTSILFSFAIVILYVLFDNLFEVTQATRKAKPVPAGKAVKTVKAAPAGDKKPGFVRRVFSVIGGFFSRMGKKIGEGLRAGWLKKILIISGAVLGVFILYLILAPLFLVRVRYAVPKGEVSFDTVIRMKFDGQVIPRAEDMEIPTTENKTAYSNVVITSNLILIKPGVHYFRIRPALEGSYRLEDGDTLIFVPSKKLNPSTRYRVNLVRGKLKTKGKLVVGKRFSFHTPDFKVTAINLFYNYAMLNQLEKEVVGEINFNVPVDINQLKGHVRMDIDGQAMELAVEPANIPTRFYLRAGKLERRDKPTKIRLVVSGKLNCIDGQKPLGKDEVREITLPEKVKFRVVQADTWPVSGNTYVAIRFNMPVSPAMINKFVSITDTEGDPVAYEAETEYCYAVLKADFKPNHNYKVTVKEGIVSTSGRKLENDYDYDVYIRDASPEVRFVSGGDILPMRGYLNVEISTINLDSFDVKIEKIFRNNLVYFLQNRYSSQFTKHLLYKTVQVETGELNDKVYHYINLRKFHDMEYKGLYKIKVMDNKSYHEDERVILCTDLGLIAKASGKDLITYVYSIQYLTPTAGAKISLVSRDNQTIAQAYTDGEGKAVFRDWRINKYDFEPYVLIAEANDDMSYLQFSRNEIDQSRFDIGGTYSDTDNMKAFLTSERGVYRPGEKAYITAMVRNGDLSLPPQINVQVVVYGPSGERYKSFKKQVPEDGLMTFDVDFPAYVKTGRYEVEMRLNEDRVLGYTSLKVEEFIPHKIRVDIRKSAETADTQHPLVFTVKGTQLFGPPAAKHKVKTSVRMFARTFAHPRFADYVFADDSRDYDSEFFDLGERQLDENGEAKYELDISSTILPPSALTARIFSEVYDLGGRPVSAVEQVRVDRYSTYFGIKVPAEDVYFVNQPVKVDYVAIDPDGRFRKGEKINLFVKHRVVYSILRKYGRDYEYESEPYEEGVYHQAVTVNGQGSFTFTPKGAGYYYIYVGREDGMRAMKRIYVRGPGMEAADLESADTLTIAFNKDKYYAGETAYATVISPIPGKLFISVERDKVLTSQVVELVNNKATVALPVTGDMLPNAYVVAYVVRRPDERWRKLPMSSLGIKRLEINPGDRRIQIGIDSVEQTRSRDGLEVRVKVSSASPHCGVVLAAVDEGILQLTQFPTPDPFRFFYALRELDTRLYSIFDAILPDVVANKWAIGGDEAKYDASRKHINPISAKRVKSLALFSGILRPDANGEIYYKFDLPRFNGRVRIMALAADEKSFGSSAKYVTISDPVVVTPSFPRAIAPGDNFEVPVRVYNKTGKMGRFAVTLEADGPVTVKGDKTRWVNIDNESEREMKFQVSAKLSAGKVVFRVKAEGRGETALTEVELPLRPLQTLQTVSLSGELDGGKLASLNVPAGFIPYGQRMRFTASTISLTRFLGSMEYLIQYPYGCNEQVTSQAFPLLYFKDLAVMTGLFSYRAGEIEHYIATAIERLESSQLSDGRFSMWPGQEYVNDYVSRYISHFLLEAERMGYQVDPKVIAKIHKNIGIDTAVRKGRLDRRDYYTLDDMDLYNLYMRALIGQPDRESMDYVREHSLKDMDYVDRCLLAACYGLTGDRKTAKEILPNEFMLKYFPQSMGGNFDSLVKRYSIYLQALCDIDPADSRKIRVMEELLKLQNNGRYPTTHDNVMALIAVSKALKDEPRVPVDLEIKSGEELLVHMTNNYNVYNNNSLSGKKLTLKNLSEGNVYYQVQVEGISLTNNLRPVDKGISVKKEYFDKEGKRLNLSSVPQGELVVATITLETKDKGVDNLVIVDLLPSGLEIENPRINSRGSLDYEPLYNWQGAYEDIRDDRLLLFTAGVSGTFHYSYTLRAVTVGEFEIPQIFAEAMYNPDVHSVGRKMGKINVVRTGQ